MACLDLERVIFSITIGIEPFTDRVARVSLFLFMGPIAPVSVNFARRGKSRLVQHVYGLGGDDDLDREPRRHLPRHAGWDTAVRRIIALSAQRLVSEAGLEHRLI